jgi:hypothetical protein
MQFSYNLSGAELLGSACLVGRLIETRTVAYNCFVQFERHAREHCDGIEHGNVNPDGM